MKKEPGALKGFLICGSVIFLIFIIYTLCLLYGDFGGAEKTGQFGDSYGLLTSLFTGLAFSGLIATLLLQKEDLKETRNEFKLQNQTFERQRFEDSFYRLLSLYKENLKDLSIEKEGGGRIYEVEALVFMLEKLQSAWAICKQSSFPTVKQEQDAYVYLLLTCIRTKLQKHRRYLETLSTILYFIYEECPEYNVRVRYCRILASQLTIYEVKYLFYQAMDSQVDAELRSLLLQSDVITNKISESNIPKGHLLAFESLWGVKIPHKSRYEFPMPQKVKLKARKAVKKQGLMPTLRRIITNAPIEDES